MQSYDRYPQRQSLAPYLWPLVLLLALAGALPWRFLPTLLDQRLGNRSQRRAANYRAAR